MENGNNIKENEIIFWLRKRGLLVSVAWCEFCNNELKEVKYKRCVDGLAFRCYKTTCTNKWKYISLRINSFFFNFNISLKKIIFIYNSWLSELPYSYIRQETRSCQNTIIKIIKALRQKCHNYFLQNPIKLGGQGVICQIDESMFKYKQKYHVGRVDNANRWVFGIADSSTTPARYFVQLVENISSPVLLPIIISVCRNGSIIWSDEWRAYNMLTNLGFEHHTVNHSLNFVNPISGVHTQNIESLWNKLKSRIKRKMGVKFNMLPDILIEFMWRDNIYNRNYNIFIDLIKFY